MSHWQPSASLDKLRLRAALIAKVRHFFQERGVLEVETPLLSHATVTDPHLQSFVTHYSDDAGQQTPLFLQTSPEYAMKRLLAAGSGSIFQISKAFRNGGELGRLHNPEFTLLEWYRPGFDHQQLMDEVDALLHYILSTPPAQRISYADLFQHYLTLNPHTATLIELKTKALACGITLNKESALYTHTDWLQLLLTHHIEPHLGREKPVFIYDFPLEQAALARIRPEDPPVAERFEVYYRGLELGNGYHELTDAQEQAQRFQTDLVKRQSLHYPTVPIDQHLLAALHAGIPACAGIALGLDRIIMLALEATSVSEVISFTLVNA